MKILNLIICFFVCLPLVMMEHTQAAHLQEIQDLSQIDYNELLNIEGSKAQENIKFLNRKLDIAIKKSNRKKLSKEQFVNSYLNRLEKIQSKQVKVVNNTLKPKKLIKLHQKLSKNQADLKIEDLEANLRTSITTKQLNTQKEDIKEVLTTFENETSLLEYLKLELNHGKLSQKHDKSPSRAIADTGMFFEILLFILILVVLPAALFVGIIWGMIALFATVPVLGFILLIPAGYALSQLAALWLIGFIMSINRA